MASADNVETRCRRVVVDQMGCDEDDVTSDSILVDDLDFDELDFVEMVMELESEFGIEIVDIDDVENLKTFDEVVQYMTRRMAARSSRS